MRLARLKTEPVSKCVCASLLTRARVAKLVRMSISESNRFARKQAPVVEQEVAYPAVFHFRIIVEVGAAAESVLEVAVAAYKITQPLTSSQASAAGRYQAYSVSVEMQSRAELYAFDAAVKSVPGVRMLL